MYENNFVRQNFANFLCFEINYKCNLWFSVNDMYTQTLIGVDYFSRVLGEKLLTYIFANFLGAKPVILICKELMLKPIIFVLSKLQQFKQRL